jgi:Flp pilus assembly protein TadG
MSPLTTVPPRHPRPPAPRTWRRDRLDAAGQSLVVFALIAGLVFGSVGLAIDAGMSYLLGDRLERAADAAALAGVPYLPTDTVGATNQALEEAARNGFPPNATTAVTPALVPGKPNELTVTISQHIGTTFLRLLGFGDHTVSRSATAIYLRPITLGQPGSQLGSDTTTLGTGGNNYYFLRTEGWKTPRSEGDAFTPDPSFVGSGQCGSGTCASNPVDMHALSCTGGTDVCSASLPAEGGQSYLLYVPANAHASLQVFNPSFAPDGNGNGTLYTYHESDTTFNPNDHTQYGGIQYTVYQVNNQFQHADDTQVSQATFWPIDARNLASGGTWVDVHAPGSPTRSGTPGVFHSWIDVGQYAGSGATGDSTLVTRTQSTTQAPLNSSDGTLPGGSQGTYYRVRVDHLGPNGEVSRTGNNVTAHKAYALRMVIPQAGGGAAPCDVAHVPASDTQGCSVGGLDDMTVFTPIQASAGAGASFQIPLLSVPPEYAGQVISVYIYDPGDVGGGAASMSIIQPAYTVGPTTVPAQVATTAASSAGLDGIDNLGPGISGPRTPVPVAPAASAPPNQAYFQTAGSSGSSLFNGQWLRVRIQVPANYNPAASADGSTYFWNLAYTVAAGASAGDTVTIKAGYDGSPVHLCPRGGITTC